MTRCRHCGEEVEEGRNFCPHCGKPITPTGEAELSPAPAPPKETQRAAPPPVPAFGRARDDGDGSRRLIFIGAAILSALAVGLLAYWATRPSVRTGEDTLAGAIRPDSPEFPPADRLVVEFDPDADALIGPTALGPYAVTMKPTVRNFTNRTVSGLEFRVAGLDLDRRVIRQRTVVYAGEIEPNKISNPALSINFPQDNRPASLKLELTGVRFK